MNQAPTPRKKHHSVLILSLFAVIIIGPMLFAWILYQKNNHYQIRLSNYGDLLSPPTNISHTPFHNLQNKENFTGETLQGKWWLVYIGPDKCYQECQNTLYNMRQLRLALGKNTSRLERLFVPHPGCPTTVCEQYLNEFYPDMLRAKMEPTDFAKIFGNMTNNTDREIIGELYIIDPLGNVMMRYAADSEASDILSDVKRLLKVSKIG